MYANKLGRFTSTDPILMSKDRMLNPQEINLYVYCQNNPLIYVDPDGKYFVGANNKKVNIQMKNGKLTYGRNVTAHLKRQIELINKSGSSKAMSGFLALANNDTKTHFKISQDLYRICRSKLYYL